MSNARKATAAFPLAIFAALALSACGKADKEPLPKVIRPVRTITIRALGAGQMRKFSGVTQAGMESKLSFKISGTIEVRKAKVGQKVKKGQLLAEIDAKDIKLELQQAQASYAQARAQQVNAQAAYERARKLYASQTASKGDLDSARAAATSARANTAAAGKQIALARSKLSYARLVSPIEGSISMVAIEVNENVSPGKVVMAVTGKAARPEVKVAIPELYISMIKPKAKVKVYIEALKGKVLDGIVSEVGVGADTASATYPVVVSIQADSKAVRAGMAAEVAFEFSAKSKAPRLVVPLVAVAQDEKGRHVFIAKKTSGGLAKVERRAVKVGALTTLGLEIREGLSDGELLITAGVSKMHAGLEVRLLPGATK